jgi:hypothetical protein
VLCCPCAEGGHRCLFRDIRTIVTFSSTSSRSTVIRSMWHRPRQARKEELERPRNGSVAKARGKHSAVLLARTDEPGASNRQGAKDHRAASRRWFPTHKLPAQSTSPQECWHGCAGDLVRETIARCLTKVGTARSTIPSPRLTAANCAPCATPVNSSPNCRRDNTMRWHGGPRYRR